MLCSPAKVLRGARGQLWHTHTGTRGHCSVSRHRSIASRWLSQCSLLTCRPIERIVIECECARRPSAPCVRHVPAPFNQHYSDQHCKTDRETERQRETQRDTERHRETQRDTERHRETHRDTERHTETHRDTQRHTETQRHRDKGKEDWLGRERTASLQSPGSPRKCCSPQTRLTFSLCCHKSTLSALLDLGVVRPTSPRRQCSHTDCSRSGRRPSWRRDRST